MHFPAQGQVKAQACAVGKGRAFFLFLFFGGPNPKMENDVEARDVGVPNLEASEILQPSWSEIAVQNFRVSWNFRFLVIFPLEVVQIEILFAPCIHADHPNCLSSLAQLLKHLEV